VTALVQSGRLAIYDWERSLLGPPDLEPELIQAVTKTEAEERAAGRPGGRIVRDEGSTDRWFALGGEPALTNEDVARAHATVDQSTQEPTVGIQFTPRGQATFETLTRTLARRGSARTADGVSAIEAVQHLVLVLDEQIVARPFIDFRHAPDGLDGSSGAQIQGGLTPETARRIAAILSAGPLPAALRLDSDETTDG
jgi:preprotein translocase subunit SecD